MFAMFGGKVPMRPAVPGTKPYLVARVALNRNVLHEAAASAASCLQIGSGGPLLRWKSVKVRTFASADRWCYHQRRRGAGQVGNFSARSIWLETWLRAQRIEEVVDLQELQSGSPSRNAGRVGIEGFESRVVLKRHDGLVIPACRKQCLAENLVAAAIERIQQYHPPGGGDSCVRAAHCDREESVILQHLRIARRSRHGALERVTRAREVECCSEC